MRLVVLIGVRHTDAAVAGTVGWEPEGGRPRFRGVLNDRLVPSPVGARRADLEDIRSILDTQPREMKLVAIILGNVERLVMRVRTRDAVYVGQAAGAQFLVEVRRGDGQAVERLQHRADAHR